MPFSCIFCLAENPVALGGVAAPNGNYCARTFEVFVDRYIDQCARPDILVPPDTPAACLERDHQRPYPEAIVPRIGYENINHMSTSSAPKPSSGLRALQLCLVRGSMLACI